MSNLDYIGMDNKDEEPIFGHKEDHMGKATEIVCIIDKSGSMWTVRDDTIGSFNGFLKEQQDLPGEANLTLALFSGKCETLLDSVPIKEADPLTDKSYAPGGLTALLDAIGCTVDSVKNRLANTDASNRPEKVICVIITDGMENSSREYGHAQIKDMIERLKEVKWEFLYLGADHDAFAVSGSMSVAAGSTASYQRTSAGVKELYGSITKGVSSFRETGKVSKDWSDGLKGDTQK